jgi:mRNA-degrading endonuclease RelE of RelBE toxin-antitoxin system
MEAGAWRVSIRPSAGHEIDELDESVRQEATVLIMDLRDDPFPAHTVLLSGYRNLYHIRFYREQFRIVYKVSSRSRRIVIERVRRRGNAYLGLRGLR